MYSVLNRIISHKTPSTSTSTLYPNLPKYLNRVFSTTNGPTFTWDDSTPSTWSTGLTRDHLDGDAVGQQITSPAPSIPAPAPAPRPVSYVNRPSLKFLERERELQVLKKALDGGDNVDKEMSILLKQIQVPGARGSYLKDSEKAEMYKKHKSDPDLYTIEKLAQEYRIMRQRVCAILWLKEDEEEQVKLRGQPFDDAVDLLLDAFPRFFKSHDREYHVASLPYKPDFKVMPEGWDGTTRDPDEVHYEISKKEDDLLYEEFCQKFNFNKMKFKNQVKVHKYSRRRPSNGWEFVVTKVGARGKRGSGGGWKFVSQPDGSTRPLNEVEKIYLKRETPRRRRKILP